MIRSVVVITFSVIIFSTGCSSHGHLKFKGIPIDGDLESFTGELVKMGYKEVRTDKEDQLKFTGKFLEKDCKIYLSTTRNTHIPYMLRVELPEEPHDSVKYNYEKLKIHCASILGPGASKYQQFDNSARFLFNEPRLERDPRNGDYTRYLSRKGSVFLEVNFNYLSVTYIDKKNSKLSVAEGGAAINMETGK